MKNFTDEVVSIIESTEMWKSLNTTCKQMYEKENRIPSTEEYQALRNMLIMKVIMETPEIMELMAKETFNYFNN
jgi:triphosphoribosyl-dephospho-CoA synthetase